VGVTRFIPLAFLAIWFMKPRVMFGQIHIRNKPLFLPIALLIFCALSLQAFIPAGFMPSANSAGTIVICSGDGFKTIPSPFDAAPLEQGDHSSNSNICAFQLTAFGQGFVPDLTPVVVDAGVIDLPPALARASLKTGTIILSLVARGPPIA
jgi:hypothetical protein